MDFRDNSGFTAEGLERLLKFANLLREEEKESKTDEEKVEEKKEGKNDNYDRMLATPETLEGK